MSIGIFPDLAYAIYILLIFYCDVSLQEVRDRDPEYIQLKVINIPICIIYITYFSND